MSRLRFTSAQEVFDAFSTVADDMSVAGTDEPPLVYLRGLAKSETPEDGVTFCAYALGRREAVWWGAQCVRSLGGIAPGQEDAALRAAEDWVREPDDGRRLAALRLGAETDRRQPSAWLALAAGWSGGNIVPPDRGHVPATPQMTPQAVRTAILVALARVPARERAPRLQTCLEGAVRLMQDDGAGRG